MIESTKGRLKQGLHPDPADPHQPRPDHTVWPAWAQAALASSEFSLFRESLLLDGISDVREAILDDLSTYFKLDKDECVRRCVHWEEWSVDELQTIGLASADLLDRFYETTQSWAFDLSWYAYLQAEGYTLPVSVAIAQRLPRPSTDKRVLDFGAGIGLTGQLFRRLGYETELADISPTLQSYARFRLERRSDSVRYIDLRSEQLEPERYDVITAIDTLVHVPNFVPTVQALHRALKPGGLLFGNFDTRPKTVENTLHLYEDDLPLRWKLQRIGFEQLENLNGYTIHYRKVDPTTPAHVLRGIRDLALMRTPARPAYRAARTWLAAVRGRTS